MRATLAILILATAVLTASCGVDGVTTPDVHLDPAAGPGTAAAGAPAVLDVGGAWNWSSIEQVAFPPFLAVLLGLTPEGDLTHGECISAGTLTLVQNGASFTGTATRESNACVTAGGAPFVQPGVVLSVLDGRVTGRALQFDLRGTVGPCPHQATATDVAAGVALALSGQGRCRLPGHPQSVVQADPPQAGYSRTTQWEASR